TAVGTCMLIPPELTILTVSLGAGTVSGHRMIDVIPWRWSAPGPAGRERGFVCWHQRGDRVIARRAGGQSQRSWEARSQHQKTAWLMAATTSRQQTEAPGGFPGRKQKEKTMIFHINLFTIKPGDEPREKGLDLMRQVGANPAVKSYVVGPEFGGEFEYGAVYVVEDLD